MVTEIGKEYIQPIKIDIRDTKPSYDGRYLYIDDFKIDMMNKELNVVYDKYHMPIGLVLCEEGTNYAYEENKRDIRRWASGNFNNNFLDECINKKKGE